MYDIRIIPNEEITSILPFLDALNNNKLSEEVLRQRLSEMCLNNYLCVGMYRDETLIGITGMWVLYKHYTGKHIELDNVMILPEYRNQKAGGILMKWVHDYAREQGCIATELNCYVQNHKGVRFWVQQGYRILGFHMQKIL
jgi:diamine N-acetyltransferase